jgi:hypothetical protein
MTARTAALGPAMTRAQVDREKSRSKELGAAAERAARHTEDVASRLERMTSLYEERLRGIRVKEERP